MDDFLGISICSLVAALHLFGMLLILRLVKQNRAKIQHFLILNMSFCILLLHILQLFYLIYLKRLPNPRKMMQYARLFAHVVYMAYIVTMGLVSVDRVLAVYLNIRYPLYVTKKKIAYAVLLKWLLCALTVAVIIVNFSGSTMTLILHNMKHVVTPAFNLVFMLLVALCYTSIVIRFTSSRVSTMNRNRIHRKTILAIVRQSRFYVAFFLVSSFLVFIVLPDLALLVLDTRRAQVYRVCYDAMFVTSEVMWAFDCIIYIYMDRKIRLVWKKKNRIDRAFLVRPDVQPFRFQSPRVVPSGK